VSAIIQKMIVFRDGVFYSPSFKGMAVEKETESNIIRLSIPIDREINERFTKMMPHGLKAEIIRCLVELVIDTQVGMGKEKYLIHHLINKECKLIIDD